ncbi:Hypothetical predicted protein [Octopus vulgaris]|uniref:Cilia- and flagella-associated protein HOATZ n=1 Tax=Octopus vulgaris TaxID=6645 RepID=A0AA36AJK4_OCTVU|nr:Hypothetical predicted protein [Octopus vulgaris]
MKLSTKPRDANDLTTFLLLWKPHQSTMPSGTSEVRYVDTYDLPDQPQIAFCDSDEKDTLLARHFWLSVHLRPFFESRLVASDIGQRTKKASLKSQDEFLLKGDNVPHEIQHITAFLNKMKNVENVYRQKFLENFNKRKKQCRLSYLSRRSQRINLQEVSGQILKKKKLFPGEEERKSSPEKDVEGPEDVRRQIAEFERKNKIRSSSKHQDKLKTIYEEKSGRGEDMGSIGLERDFERFQAHIEKFQKNIKKCEEKHNVLNKLTYNAYCDDCVKVEDTEKTEELEENTENIEEMDILENDSFKNKKDCV